MDGLRRWWLVALTLAAAVTAQETRTQPLGGGPAGVERLALVPLGGLEAALQPGAGLKVTFQKEGPERRLLALEATPAGDLTFAKALELSYRISGLEPQAARLAVVFHEADGGVRYKLGPAPTIGAPATSRISLAEPREALFSADASGKFETDRIARVWVGLTIDGPAAGTLEITRAVLTNEPYRPTGPLLLDLGKPEQWGISKESGVTAKITCPAEGPAGQPVYRLDFTFPATAHQWVVPSLPWRAENLEGYRALRLTYKVTAPAGPNLLLALAEPDGSTYVIDPPPAISTDWKTIEVPLAQLKLASWTKDEDSSLLLDGVAVQLGIHGQPKPPGAGSLWVAEVALVP
ncbi:MAG: hypothetical protein HUU35_07425 [Armatimonadetes bacterium]|nr:hypothetical protein [Armatimonadota bacterium]